MSGFAPVARGCSTTDRVDQYTAGSFLPIAVARAFGKHALQATINTITAVFQAMSQPPIAKFADVWGRVNAYIGCVVFYVVGYIIVASSGSIGEQNTTLRHWGHADETVVYAVGNSIYILGESPLLAWYETGRVLMLQVSPGKPIF